MGYPLQTSVKTLSAIGAGVNVIANEESNHELMQVDHRGQGVVIVDAAVENHPATQDILNVLLEPCRAHKVVTITGGEDLKQQSQFLALKQQAEEVNYPTKNIIAIGGGALLNVATAIAAFYGDRVAAIPATLERQHVPSKHVNLVMVPTTVLAMADVAYGSKGNINGKTHKHELKVWCDPQSIILDPRFIQTLPASEKKRGLVECLKHALLQDRDAPHPLPIQDPSYKAIMRLLRQNNPRAEACYGIACQTMYAKAALLGKDKYEKTWLGAYLSYGHLHAHAIEAATRFRVPHGDAVLFGMLVDLKLAGDENIYHDLLKVVPYTPLADYLPDIQKILPATLQKAYQHETKPFFKVDETTFKVLPITQIGGRHFDSLQDADPLVEKSLAEITTAVADVLRDTQKQVANSKTVAGQLISCLQKFFGQ